MFYETGGKWQYNCSFVGFSFQELFKMARINFCSSHRANYLDKFYESSLRPSIHFQIESKNQDESKCYFKETLYFLVKNEKQEVPVA